MTIAEDQIDDMLQQEAARGTGHWLDPEQDMEQCDDTGCPYASKCSHWPPDAGKKCPHNKKGG